MPVKTPQQGGVLWYLFVLIGIYLVAPFLSAVFTSHRSERVFLVIWLLGTFALLIEQYVPEAFGRSLVSQTTAVTYFSGYIGYFILGHYMHHYAPPFSSRNRRIARLLLLAGVVLWGLGKLIDKNNYTEGSFALGAVIVAVTLFWLLKYTNIRSRVIVKAVDWLAPLTFGIYLSQIVVITVLTGRLYGISSSILMQITVVGVTFTLAALLTWLLSKLPFSKYLIGI